MIIYIENCIIKVSLNAHIEIQYVNNYFLLIINGKVIAKTDSSKICIRKNTFLT